MSHQHLPMRPKWFSFACGACLSCFFGATAAAFFMNPAFLSIRRVRSHQHRASTVLQSKLRILYPPCEAIRNGTLKVDATHTLFYQEYHGSIDTSTAALTALFLHGGPGAGCSSNHARFFDPSKYRIILLDQRGAGQSEPRGEALINNTLWHLVQDCEAIRKHLDIRKWDVVFGGSWGSTLAIAYAQEYPDSIRSLVLRGVCLLRQSEVDWLTSSNGGAAAMDPEGWLNFTSAVGIRARTSSVGRQALYAYYDRLLGSNREARLMAAKSWFIWEMRVSSVARQVMGEQVSTTILEPDVLVWNHRFGWRYYNQDGTEVQQKSQIRAMEESQRMRRGIMASSEIPYLAEVTQPRSIHPMQLSLAEIRAASNLTALGDYIPAQAMLTCFYSVNCHYALDNVDFLSPERMSKIRKIRCIAVQGANDAICPPDTALDLHVAWPEMELRIPTMSGHSMYDAAITHELVQGTDRLATELLQLL
jgi:proline iminopeptidase